MCNDVTNKRACQRLCSRQDVPEGEARSFMPEGSEPIAVYRIGGEFYATQDTCTHGRASLGEGWLDDFRIACPAHGGAFDIRTGQPRCFPVTGPIKVFKVWVAGDDVLADLTSAKTDVEWERD